MAASYRRFLGIAAPSLISRIRLALKIKCGETFGYEALAISIPSGTLPSPHAGFCYRVNTPGQKTGIIP